MKMRSLSLFTCSLASISLAAVTHASIVAVDDAFFVDDMFTGSRTTVGTTGVGGGLTWNPADGGWSDGNFTIEWKITDNGADFTYEYTVSSPSKDISHWILQLSAEDADGNSLQDHWDEVFGEETVMTIEPDDPDDPGQSGNPGLPGNIYGFKDGTEGPSVMLEFTTPEIPVWGDFYAKDGGGQLPTAIIAYNTGFGTMPPNTGDEVLADFLDWIPRPDGQVDEPTDPGGNPEVPEPISFLVWSALICCWVALQRSYVPH